MKTTPFLIRVAICFVLSLIPLPDFEQWIYSARMELRPRRESPTNIVVLEISDAEFKTLKHRFSPPIRPGTFGPWVEISAASRVKSDRLEGLRDLAYWDPAFFRESLRKLLSQGPAAVLVTWYIPNEIAESLPEAGVELLGKSRRVIWSSQFDPEGKFDYPSPQISGSNFGFNNLKPDSDGVIRRSVLLRQGQPSLTRAAWTSGLQDAGDADGLERFRDSYLINYAGPSGTILTCKLLDVVTGQARDGCANLKDRIVLLAKREGERSGIDSTYFRTPLGEMSRAEILANELNTVLNHKRIYQAPWPATSLLILAMILVGAFYIIYYPVLISAIALSGTVLTIALILLQIVFLTFDIYIPSANLLVSALITYLVFTGYRLAFQENIQWRSLKQAQYLRELDQMKSNFLSLVSHDLKTPLAKIQGVVERIRRESKLSEHERGDWADLVDSIENSNNELKHYVTSILNLSKIESQKVILNKRSNDINRIIQLSLKRLRPLAQNRGIQFEEHLEPLFSVECDEDLIRQVLTNLIDNAIKYSPDHAVVIVRSREEEGFIRVDVEDFGPGIPKDQLPLMFRKFSRFLRPIKEQVKGTGLGLYLSKYFIELHGGRIRVRSEEGKGTNFTFTLPLRQTGPHSSSDAARTAYEPG